MGLYIFEWKWVFFIKKIFYFLFYLQLDLRGDIGIETVSNPYEPILIPPQLIQKIGTSPDDFIKRVIPSISYNIGQIRGGNWDIVGTSFEESDFYVSFKERFLKGKKWEETPLYHRVKNDIEIENKIEWSFLLKKYKVQFIYWDNLYENIKLNGYKNQTQLGNINISNEVRVLVSRNGEILFQDGWHRLSIAKILDLNQIPVIVSVWHKEYVKKVRDRNRKFRLTPQELIEPILSNNKNQKVT
jgi:hypothetical protein